MFSPQKFNILFFFFHVHHTHRTKGRTISTYIQFFLTAAHRLFFFRRYTYILNMSNIAEDQMEEFKQAFALFDKDGNGHVDAGELGQVLASLGQIPTEGEIQRMINEVDGDLNGTIEFPEFLQMMQSKMSKKENEEEIQEAFNTFDVKGNGKITANALQGVFKSLNETFTDEEVKEMIKVVGSNGEVNFNQFKNMMLMR